MEVGRECEGKGAKPFGGNKVESGRVDRDEWEEKRET